MSSLFVKMTSSQMTKLINRTQTATKVGIYNSYVALLELRSLQFNESEYEDIVFQCDSLPSLKVKRHGNCLFSMCEPMLEKVSTSLYRNRSKKSDGKIFLVLCHISFSNKK